MNPLEICPEQRLFVNTNHANLPAWAWKTPQVTVITAPTQDGYALVETTDGQRRRIHTTHLRTTPTPLGATPARTMPGAIHRTKPEAGEELSLLDPLEKA
jgi:hypothetical protein